MVERTFLQGEPPLCEVLEDPIVHLLMTRDGVSRDALAKLVEEAAARLRPVTVDAAEA